MDKYLKISALVLILLGLLLRALVISHSGPSPDYQQGMNIDEVNYLELASNIADKKFFGAWSEGFFTQSTRAPGYPVLLASMSLISGKTSAMLPQILNFLLDMLNILLVFMIGRNLYGKKAALTAAVLYATLGATFIYVKFSTSEVFAVTLFLSSCYFLSTMKNFYRWSVLGFCIVFAFLIHTKPVFLLVLPFVAICIYFRLRDNHLQNKSCLNQFPSEGNSLNHGRDIAKRSDACQRQNQDPPRLRRFFASIMPHGMEGRPCDVRNLICLLDHCLRTETLFGRIIRSLVPVAIVLLFCIPWAARNYAIHKSLIPICTFSGWHLLVSAESADDLSLKNLTDYVYAPRHSDFTEGEFYRESVNVFMTSFFSHPVKFIAAGIYRFSYYWIPQKPYLRIFKPKAYIMPIYITDRIFIPVPDFEGILYVSLMIAAVAAIRLKRKFIPLALKWLAASTPFVLLIVFYAAVHIIGIPLEQYRFIIEPLFIILACGFAFAVFKENSGPEPSVWEIRYALAVPSMLLLIIAILGIGKGKSSSYEYPKATSDPGSVSYSDIRSLQWKNLGNIPEKTICETMGEVKYLVKDLSYDAKLNKAVEKKGMAVAKLYVKLHDPENPRGLGDMKLNFKDGSFPNDGGIIKVKGPVYTGEYKDIIMDVILWGKLDKETYR
ncbi:MAG TPA: hypothetical protein DCZ94_07575 [Lentisphaeria bacterium]|nr:MAG: hypothetical protein A2X48_14250 [Lentisphaerae bacterium GWF2_49_21]HBC86796.1 hypothetical protein [Lentisphaeria bacterium]